MKNYHKKKLYWFPPKGFGEFFRRSSDDEYRALHPIKYYFVVALSMAALLAPMIVLGISLHTPTVGFAGIVGAFIIGIGLFNFVAIIMDQYLGHLVSILSFIIGGILIATEIGIF